MWRTTVTLVADDSWTTSPPYDGNTHTEDSESLAATFLPDDIQISKLYLPEYQTENIPGGKRKPGVNEDILSSANLSGTLLMNWYGHGNPQVWAHEHVLNRETDITKMINLDKLFFLTAGTCDYARFDMTENQSGAEDMLLSRSGGAIGVFSSSRLVYASSNSLITQEFYHQLFTRDTESGLYPTIGEVLFRVKQRYNALNDVKFFVLGDPSIRLLIPDHRAEITIDSVDGKPVDNKAEEIQIKALSKVSLSCVIKDRSIDQFVSDFNGKAFMTMLDGDDEITVEDFDGSMHYILKHGGALNRSSYDVRSGRFSAEITVPRDISFSGNSGRLYVYAYAEDGRQAKGGIRSYEVNGINPNANPDDKGPEINIFMDARSFRQGEIVSEEPLLIVDLRDSTGLNTTGRGIGHGIEAWLNDDPQSIDLTEYFTTSPEDPKSGTVRRKLSKLEPGLYTVKVRAWDIFNNYSVAETYFRVAPENDIVISDIRNYPNPFDNATTIRFRHNIAPPFEAQLKIYTTTGQMVRVLNSDIFTYHEGEIFWDGFDSYGNKVSQGMYFYNVMIRTANGNTANKSAAASFIR